MAKITSVTINGISYNADHALALGKEAWTKEVSNDFDGNTSKAGEAFDAIKKQLDAKKVSDEKEAALNDAATKAQAEAAKALEAREGKAAPVVSGPANATATPSKN